MKTMLLYIILLGKVKGYLKNNWVHLRITYLVFTESVLKYTCTLKMWKKWKKKKWEKVGKKWCIKKLYIKDKKQKVRNWSWCETHFFFLHFKINL